VYLLSLSLSLSLGRFPFPSIVREGILRRECRVNRSTPLGDGDRDDDSGYADERARVCGNVRPPAARLHRERRAPTVPPS